MILLVLCTTIAAACAVSFRYPWLTLLPAQVYGCDYQMLIIHYYEHAELRGPFSGTFFPPPPGAYYKHGNSLTLPSQTRRIETLIMSVGQNYKKLAGPRGVNPNCMQSSVGVEDLADRRDFVTLQ